MNARTDNALGRFLRDRRGRLDPAALGFSMTRRRTPGLRREEVAQRAHVSATWYTWLEQGRGGAPSAQALERIAAALMLTDAEREHVFLLALGRPPEVRYRGSDGVSPRLQGVLDALETSPALIRTATWDVVAWNRAAAAVLTDYAQLEAAQRNILRLIFAHREARMRQRDWDSMARFVVASFRSDIARAGATTEVKDLVDELCRLSPEFAALWRSQDISEHSEGRKLLQHPEAGTLELEFSSFVVDGRPDLCMVIYNPATETTRARVRALLDTL